MGFLLERRPVPTPDETAESVRRQPTSARAAVAHALALWRGKRPAEAVGVLDAVPAQNFAEPRYALAFGIVLAEVDRARESVTMLDRAAVEPLLPEERALIEKTRQRNQAAPAANSGR